MKRNEAYINDDGIVTQYSARPGAKLTIEQVREIRKRYAEGDISQDKLAKEYNVTLLTIGNIIRGKTWREECLVSGPTVA
jgi:DNA invertase Pin-like site-specific DNA recombinase